MGQYDRPRVFGCEPVDGVLVVLSSNQINIATFVHQMGNTHISLLNGLVMYLIKISKMCTKLNSGMANNIQGNHILSTAADITKLIFTLQFGSWILVFKLFLWLVSYQNGANQSIIW